MRAETTAEPLGRRERRRRELHDHIYGTARGLFLARGFDGVTVEQIAEAADIAPATFFNHFPSKHDVLREMAGEVYGHFATLVEEQLARDASTRERLEGFADRAAALVRKAPELTRSVLLEVMTGTREPATADRLAGIHEQMTMVVRIGRDRGDVRTDESAEFLGEMCANAFIGCMTSWINDPDYPLHDHMRRAASFLTDALSHSHGAHTN